jgi:EmrB/QacA subfamily drug resistance transporter
MGSATNVALPAIGRQLQADATSLGWMQTLYLLTAAAFLVPFGKLADRRGRKGVFVAGMAVYSAASLLCAAAPTYTVLLAARAVQGVGGGMISGISVALITTAFPGGRRGGALGINTAAVYLGLSLGPVLGGLLTQQFGWRAVFLANAAVGVFTMLVAAWGLQRAAATPSAGPFDLAGSLLYGLALAATMYGLEGLPSATGALLVAGGAAGMAVFFRREVRAPDPVLDLGLFRANRVFALSNLAALTGYAATFAVSFLMSIYLQQVSGLTPRAAGALLAIQPLLQTAVSPFSGRLSDRVDARVVASAGMAAIAAGLGLLVLIAEDTTLAFVAACLALLGVGFGLFSSPNTNAVMSSVDARSHGVGAAILATTRFLGQMLSMSLAGMILGLFVGRDAVMPWPPGAFVSGLRTAFAVFAALSLAATFASLARGRTATGSAGADPR